MKSIGSVITILSLVTSFLFLTNNDLAAQTCYITKTGAKYHTSTCGYLSHSAYPLDINLAITAGYAPCSRCRPTQSSSINSYYIPHSYNSSKTTNYNCSTVICSGTTKTGRGCRNKTRDCSGRCHHHR